MLSAIRDRRSVRCFLDRPVSKEIIQEILLAGTLAPSSKNRQPWRFIVTAGQEKGSLLSAMERGLERERLSPLLSGSIPHLSGAKRSLAIMAEAPVVILAMDPLGLSLERSLTPEERVYEICNAQSLGAAMENMSLTAVELGLGSLWIADTYFAYQELTEWAGGPGALFAALALGYPGETPPPRPRKPLDEVTEWRMG